MDHMGKMKNRHLHIIDEIQAKYGVMEKVPGICHIHTHISY